MKKSFLFMAAIGLIPFNIEAGTTTATVLQTDKVFAPTSFWYTPIPSQVRLHPNNANLVKEFNRQRVRYFNTVNINTKSYTLYSPCRASDS
jgi:hypothetical protein